MRPTKSRTGRSDGPSPGRRGRPCGYRERRRRGRHRGARSRCAPAPRRTVARAARRSSVLDARITSLHPITSDSARGTADRLVLEVLRLHPRQRVERGDERQLELVLQRVAGDTRQPVVGVDERRLLALADPLAHACRELVDELGQIVLVDRLGRARHDVVDAEAGLDSDDWGQPGLRGARVDVAGQPGAGQRSRELTHVDVHASAVAGARLCQR